MAKHAQNGTRKAVKIVARKARAGRSASVMKPEYLAEIERFRLMDDDFMSKCLEHAPECIELILMHFDVLKKRVSQFKDSEEGRYIMCKAVEEYAERRAAESKAEGKAEGIAEGERKGKRETMLAMAKRLLANGKLMLKEIAECTGLSLAQVKKLQAEMA